MGSKMCLNGVHRQRTLASQKPKNPWQPPVHKSPAVPSAGKPKTAASLPATLFSVLLSLGALCAASTAVSGCAEEETISRECLSNPKARVAKGILGPFYLAADQTKPTTIYSATTDNPISVTWILNVVNCDGNGTDITAVVWFGKDRVSAVSDPTGQIVIAYQFKNADLKGPFQVYLTDNRTGETTSPTDPNMPSLYVIADKPQDASTMRGPCYYSENPRFNSIITVAPQPLGGGQ